MKVNQWTGFHYINFLHNYHCHLDFYQDKACQGKAAAQYSLFMPKWQKPLCHISGEILCPSLSKSSTGSPKSRYCSLSCQPAPSESKWWFLVYIVQRHFVMSCSVPVSVAASWCCQLALWCNLQLPSEFWQKQSSAAWHGHLRAGDVREPREPQQRVRKRRWCHKQHNADHKTSLHDPDQDSWLSRGRFWFSALPLE